jgi:hypothetical protein
LAQAINNHSRNQILKQAKVTARATRHATKYNSQEDAPELTAGLCIRQIHNGLAMPHNRTYPSILLQARNNLNFSNHINLRPTPPTTRNCMEKKPASMEISATILKGASALLITASNSSRQGTQAQHNQNLIHKALDSQHNKVINLT